MLGFFLIVKAASRFVLFFFFLKEWGKKICVCELFGLLFTFGHAKNTPNTVFGWKRRLLIRKEKEIYDV